jgi:hypothetical protein
MPPASNVVGGFLVANLSPNPHPQRLTGAAARGHLVSSGVGYQPLECFVTPLLTPAVTKIGEPPRQELLANIFEHYLINPNNMVTRQVSMIYQMTHIVEVINDRPDVVLGNHWDRRLAWISTTPIDLRF